MVVSSVLLNRLYKKAWLFEPTTQLHAAMKLFHVQLQNKTAVFAKRPQVDASLETGAMFVLVHVWPQGKVRNEESWSLSCQSYIQSYGDAVLGEGVAGNSAGLLSNGKLFTERKPTIFVWGVRFLLLDTANFATCG